ncbi:tetratricopeptide repeat protein [Streptomyces sp. B6B3]|uniref:serine/threonine-protein kinase n=1 Tax=Streptomyces sp. B6B3 TaxID=3153570 RepID=UPI00325F538E
MSDQTNLRTRPCQRPGCEGSYEDVGGGELYCDTCGMAPVVSPGGMIGSAPTGVTGAAAGSGSSGSGRSSGSGSGSTPSSSRSSQSSQSSRSSRSSRSQFSRRSVSGRLSRSVSGQLTSRSVSVRSSRSSTGAGGRSRLGVGVVAVPEVPRPDPREAVLEQAEVPERKRFCGNSDCGAPVGRARGGRPGRTEGFCTKCGHPYSFVPKLSPGDAVHHGQYEIAGCLAHGGLGWIYLAKDLRVSNRWVVLKGLLDTGDEDARAAAISERQFLAEIQHPSIVRIYNFVEHLDQRTGSLDGYIVMEYVGGKSLKEIANSRRTPEGRRDPLPVAQACAYGIEALDALGYLHGRNLLYCDFKVDNAIQQDDQLKLIDMGAVRRADDEESAIYGTIGYQAPEVAETGPTVPSDLYTVARTLAVLTFDFQGYTSVYADGLPEPDSVEVFQRYESFYRFLVRATDPDPQRRFASAQEMAEQLTGVLREVVAIDTGQPQPAMSQLFGPELRVVDTELVPARRQGEESALGGRNDRRRIAAATAVPAPGGPPGQGALPLPGQRPPQAVPGPGGPPAHPAATHPAVPHGGTFQVPAGAPRTVPPAVRETALALPVPRVDPGDPNAGFLAGLMATSSADLITALRSAPTDSVERRLRELRAWLELADASAVASARQALAELEDQHADDWRVVWYRGLSALVTEDWETAALAFDAVYDAFPGEVAPKLALGVCAEVLGQLDNAADYYELVWRTDPSHVSAGFGLARVRLASGDRLRAVAALESVPETSAHCTAARVAAVRARLRQRSPHEDLLPDLLAAGRQVASLRAAGLEPSLGEQLSCEVLGSALDWVLAGRQNQSQQQMHVQQQLLGVTLDETGVRLGLERCYRRLARLAPSSTERIELVEAANRFRPRTWV